MRRSLTIDEFTERSKGIHGEKYDYSKVNYINNYTKIEIFCFKHGSFWQIPYNHLRGKGCPICRNSKGELKIYNFLKENDIPFIQQKWFKNCRNDITNRVLRFDFYIPSKNLLIEYDGKQHFVSKGYIGSFICSEDTLKNIKLKDEIKNEFVKNNNIDLLRISYKKIYYINKILKEKFSLL
jgi:very-short-patch-repair endonuclease